MKKHYATIFYGSIRGKMNTVEGLYVSNYNRNLPCSSSILTMYRIWFVFFRLVLNPFYGVLLDNKGVRKKKWLWHNLKEHVHAPPFQPITFMITKQLSIRCLSQVLVSMLFKSFKRQLPHANSPNRSLCISLKNELREFVKKS